MMIFTFFTDVTEVLTEKMKARLKNQMFLSYQM